MVRLLVSVNSTVPAGEYVGIYTHLNGKLKQHRMTRVDPIMKSVLSQSPVSIYNTGTHSPSVIHEPVAPHPVQIP
jgi:hypothetical protein